MNAALWETEVLTFAPEGDKVILFAKLALKVTGNSCNYSTTQEMALIPSVLIVLQSQHAKYQAHLCSVNILFIISIRF